MGNEIDRTDDVAPATIVDEYPLAVKLHLSDRITQRSLWSEAGVLEALLAAESLEDVASTFEMLGTDDVAGKLLMFRGVSFAPSRFAESRLGVYALVDAVDADTGEKVRFSTGGEAVVVTLLRAAEQAWFPFNATIEKADMTAAGFQPWNLVPQLGVL